MTTTTDIAAIGIALDSTQVKEGTKALDSLDRVSQKVTGTVKGLIGAWVGWRTIKSIIVDSALLNARFETMGVVMERVGRNSGYSSTQMREWEVSLRKTGIAMVEARTVLTRMAQAQLDLTQTSKLARVAQDAAVIGAVNSSEAFERMVYAIQSGQVEMLRTLGINVSFEQSYAKMAQQLGVNARQLTEAQKTQARMNAVLESGTKIAGVYEEAMGTAGKQMLSMKRYTDDLKVKFGEVFNEALTAAVFGLTEQFKDANHELDALAEDRKLEDWAHDLTVVLAILTDGLVGVAGGIYQVGAAVTVGIAQLGALAHGDIKMARAYGDEWATAFNKYLSSIGSATAKVNSVFAQRQQQRDKDTQREKNYLNALLIAQKTYANASLEVQRRVMESIAAAYYPKEPVGWVPPKPQGGLAGGTGVPKKSEAQTFLEGLRKEVDTYGMGEIAMKRYEASKLRLNKANAAAAEGYIRQLDAMRRLDEQAQYNNDLFDEAMAKENARVDAMRDAIVELSTWVKEQQEEARLINMTNAQREVAIRLRRAEAAGIDTQTESFKRLAEQVRNSVDFNNLNRLTSATPSSKLKNDQEDMVLLAKAFTEGIRDANGELHKLSEAQYLEAVIARLNLVAQSTDKAKSFAQELGYTFQSAFEDAVIGGKKFRDVLLGIAQDIQRIVLRKTITEPLGNAVSGLLGSIDWGGLFGFAEGGIMTSKGPLPLHAYAAGGVATSPQMMLFGEGSMNEAVVPLPNGRSIPVEMKGNGGQQIVVHQNFNIDARGTDANIESRLRQAVEEGARRGYSLVINDLSRGGPVARMTGTAS